MTKETKIIYAAPIRSDNTVVGVLIGEKDSLDLNNTVGQMGFGENGFAFLISREGKVNAHQDISHVLNDRNIFEDIDKDGEYKDVALRLSELGMGNTGIIEYEISGAKRYMGIAPIKSTGWVLGVGALKKDVLVQLNLLRNSIILVSIVFCLLEYWLQFL